MTLSGAKGLNYFRVDWRTNGHSKHTRRAFSAISETETIAITMVVIRVGAQACRLARNTPVGRTLPWESWRWEIECLCDLVDSSLRHPSPNTLQSRDGGRVDPRLHS